LCVVDETLYRQIVMFHWFCNMKWFLFFADEEDILEYQFLHKWRCLLKYTYWWWIERMVKVCFHWLCV